MNRYRRMKARRISRFEYCGEYHHDGGKYLIVWHSTDFGDVYYTTCMMNPQ